MPFLPRGVLHTLPLVVILLSSCSSESVTREHFERGERYLATNRTAEAIVEFRNAVGRDDKWGLARFKLAEAYAANGDPEHAFREYLRAADLMPDDATAQLRASTYLSLVGQYEDARTRAQRVLDRDSSNIEAQIALGNALAGLRDLDGAVTQITEALQIDPQRSQAYTNLGRVRVAQGRIEEARAAFQKAVTTGPRSIAARLALANFQWSQGDIAATERHLNEALAIDGSDVLTHRVLAAFYLETARAPKAEPHLAFVADTTRTNLARFNLADYYAAYDQPQKARRILEPLAAQAVTRSAAETRVAAIDHAEGHVQQAYDRLNAVLAREPNHSAALLQMARWLLMEGKAEAALMRAQSALAASPRLVGAHYIRGVAEARTQRTAEAIKSFTEVIRLDAGAVDARIQLSRLHLARYAFDSAVISAQEAVAASPGNVEARLALIRAWIARGDDKTARAEIAVLKERKPPAAGAFVLDGTLSMRAGNLSAARAAFERAWQLDATSIEALTGLTTVDVLRKDTRGIRARIDARLQADPNNQDLLLLAGRAFLESGDAARAEEVLRRSVALDPQGTANVALLARVLAGQNQLERAGRDFEDALQRDPSNLAARIMAAVLTHARGNLPEAKRRYEEILTLEPRAALAANNLAAIFADEGERMDRAQQLGEMASEQWPADAEIQDTLGWIYYRRQSYGLAIRQFQRSVTADPRNPTFHYHLGLAHSKNGETDRAREALERALRLNPRLAEAREALQALIPNP
jgi:tetratricopeptide (TPR) repeat protein